MFTKGKWWVEFWDCHTTVEAESQTICTGVSNCDAHLIAAAPLGYELAEFVSRISATWIDEGLLEIGEGDYTRMKQLALEFKSKAEGKEVTHAYHSSKQTTAHRPNPI